MIRGQDYYKGQVRNCSKKNEYLCMFILDRGNVYLDLMDGRILPGNGILT